MKHLKKFESIRNPVQRNIEDKWRDCWGPYKEMLNDFLQDIRDEEFEVIISPFANKFEIIIKYKISPIYSDDINSLFKDLDKQAKLFQLVKELLERIKNCGDFVINFAHFSETNPRFNLTVSVK